VHNIITTPGGNGSGNWFTGLLNLKALGQFTHQVAFVAILIAYHFYCGRLKQLAAEQCA